MRHLISLLIVICLMMSFSFREYSQEAEINDECEHKTLKGLLLIGWSIYAGWLGYTMLTGDFDVREGDWKLVGGLLVTIAPVTLYWGITLIF